MRRRRASCSFAPSSSEKSGAGASICQIKRRWTMGSFATTSSPSLFPPIVGWLGNSCQSIRERFRVKCARCNGSFPREPCRVPFAADTPTCSFHVQTFSGSRERRGRGPFWVSSLRNDGDSEPSETAHTLAESYFGDLRWPLRHALKGCANTGHSPTAWATGEIDPKAD